MALNVHIVTPTAAVFSGEASSVRIQGWEGEFEVLEGHDILLALLRGGLTVVTTPSGVKRFVTGRGFVEVGPNSVNVLTDSCEPAGSADKDAARDALKASDATKLGTTMGSPAWDTAEEQAELAHARLSA